ncbi:Outer membrane usher protein [Candidatus Methylobacter favarea]|uniref:Outer membrane usher protein n=1 Tax=Candidatus Methylobacter favarea TaxID=2707345 RepID=A0A8S0WCX5_9GAMM|nr:fimbria/pilus outer membrane usher protein [Candidatus Methylobacter favarea]CAA9892815.1 Outer membrane usher protein [Candidatus Methylobacter favarea]
MLLAVSLPYCPTQVVASSPDTALTGSPNQTQDRVAGKPGHFNGPQALLLDVRINTRKLADVIRVEKLADGRLILPVEAWLEARLRPVGEKLALPDGNQGYALDAVPGLQYQLDSGRLALDITAPAEAFEASALDQARGGEAPPNPAPPGFYFNYNLTGTRSGSNGLSYGAFVEAVAFNGWGSLVLNGLMRGDDKQRRLIRTDTYWQTDLPGSMETLVLGDAIGTGGAWSRPARFGGIRWARNFALRPGYFTFPLPSLSGSAALPSTVDVLINNQRQQSQTVAPGPFAITNVPVVTGAGEVNLVVRDLLGVETLVTQSYYTSPRLLAEGLSDFSFEAGWLRENFASQSLDYGAGFAAGTWRQGFNGALTGEARLELQLHRQAAGLELAGLLGHFAVGRAAAAFARADGELGGHYLLGLERRSLGGSGSLQGEHFDRGYVQFGALPHEIRPRDRFTAGFGMPLLLGVSAGVSYISQSNWDGDPFQLATANLGFSLPWNMYLNAFASKQLNEDNGWSGGLNLILPLGAQRSVSASSNRATDGRLTNALLASQSVSQGPGLGWRVRISDDANQQLQAGGTLNSDYGQVTADFNLGNNDTALRLGANGSIGWLQGLPFTTRNIGHGSFAVVKVGDIKDVPVYRSNQIAATTNSSGLALVPNLLPYQKNRITIEPGELPFDVEIKGVKAMALPYARSGVLVEFPVRRSRNALVVLHQANGKPVPGGAQVTVTPSGLKFTVAKRGQVYLTDLESNNRIAVQWRDGRCDLAIPLPAGGPAEPRIGPLTCGDPR